MKSNPVKWCYLFLVHTIACAIYSQVLGQKSDIASPSKSEFETIPLIGHRCNVSDPGVLERALLRKGCVRARSVEVAGWLFACGIDAEGKIITCDYHNPGSDNYDAPFAPLSPTIKYVTKSSVAIQLFNSVDYTIITLLSGESSKRCIENGVEFTLGQKGIVNGLYFSKALPSDTKLVHCEYTLYKRSDNNKSGEGEVIPDTSATIESGGRVKVRLTLYLP